MRKSIEISRDNGKSPGGALSASDRVFRGRISVSDIKGQFPSGEPETVELEVLSHGHGELRYISHGIRERLAYNADGATLYLDLDQGNRVFRDVTSDPPVKADAAGSGIVKAPMDGNCVKVLCGEGDAVTKGQLLGVIEAMKMEHSIKADVDGVIKSLKMQIGKQVKVRQILVEITPALAAEVK